MSKYRKQKEEVLKINSFYLTLHASRNMSTLEALCKIRATRPRTTGKTL